MMRRLRYVLNMRHRQHKSARFAALFRPMIALALILVASSPLAFLPTAHTVLAQQATVPPPPQTNTETPTPEDVAAETPTADAATLPATVTDSPTSDVPTSDAPTSDIPTSDSPASDVPTLAAPATIRATVTPTPLPDYVLRSESDIVYPTALVSYFEFARPKEEFVAATLTLRQEGWSRGPISVDYAGLADEVDGITRLTYVWEITADDSPRVFEDVEFTWVFVENDGSETTFIHNIYFADPRTTWAVIEPSNSQIMLAFPSGRATVSALTLSLEASYALLQNSTGQSDFNPTIRLVVYDGSLTANACQSNTNGESTTAGREIGIELPCDPDAVTNNIYAPNNFQVIQLSSSTSDNIQSVTTGALFDEFYNRLWAETGAAVPAWFREGLKKFYQPGVKTTEYELSRSAARAGGALRRMETVPQDEAQRAQWSAQSYGMVLYMAEQLGVDGLFELARSLGPENTLADAYEAATGTALSGLMSAWSTWLFTTPALSAYNYSPYLPNTPTPTSTPTRTPTVTRTPTPTSTPTITPTITGVLSATPRPPTAVPPTVTPSLTSRPAGSQPIPIETPVVATAEAVEGDDEGQRTVTLLIGFGLMALGILIAMAALFLRNRSLDQGANKSQ